MNRLKKTALLTSAFVLTILAVVSVVFVLSPASPLAGLPVGVHLAALAVPVTIAWLTHKTVRALSGNDRWGKVRSLDELRDLMVEFIEGKVTETPWHLGPLEPESTEIRDHLREINRHGFVTDNSQPGGIYTEGKQRAYVSGIVTPGMYVRLREFAHAEGYVFASNPGQQLAPSETIPVTVGEDGRVWTRQAVGVAFPLNDIPLPRGVRRVVEENVTVSLVDVEWGSNRLFDRIAAFLSQKSEVNV